MTAVQPISLGDNTVYLIDLGGSRVLIDTGPDYRGAAGELVEAIRGRLPDLVVATHGHLDHAGLGSWWQERGVPVAVHPADWPLATGEAPSDAEFEALQRFPQESGAPPDVAIPAAAAIAARRAWVRASRTADGYPPGGRDRRWPTGLRYRPFTPRLRLDEVCVPGIELLHLPGHTPGNAVAWLPNEGWLFSGDQLLLGLTPTPALQAHHDASGPDWRFRSFPAFLGALRKLESLHPARCFPGHGSPFGDVNAVIAANLEQAEQRIQRTLEVLMNDGPLSLYDVAARLYPRALRRRFWQIAATVQGFLDALESEGLAASRGGRWHAVQAASAPLS